MYGISIQGGFCAYPVEILVFPSPTGSVLISFCFFFIYFEAYSIYSSRRIDEFFEVLNFNRLFLKLNRFIYN